MAQRAADDGEDQLLDKVLGYLNFSSGAADLQFLANLNELFRRHIAEAAAADAFPWRIVVDRLAERLAAVRQSSAAFQDAGQAAAILDLLRQHVISGYLEFHRDLLFHQQEGWLIGPFFLGRVC